MYSKLIVATRGIIVGSGIAATELKLLLLPLMKLLDLQWSKSLVAKVYVDDLTLIVRAPIARVAEILSDVLNFVIDHLQNFLKMQFAERKIQRCLQLRPPLL